jgi:hypothetical protein
MKNRAQDKTERNGWLPLVDAEPGVSMLESNF